MLRDRGPRLARQEKHDRRAARARAPRRRGRARSPLPSRARARRPPAPGRAISARWPRIGEERRRVVVGEVLEVLRTLRERRELERERRVQAHEEIRAERARRRLSAGDPRSTRRRCAPCAGPTPSRRAANDAVVQRRQERSSGRRGKGSRSRRGRACRPRPPRRPRDGPRRSPCTTPRTEPKSAAWSSVSGTVAQSNETSGPLRPESGCRTSRTRRFLPEPVGPGDEEGQRRGREGGDPPPELAHRGAAPPEEPPRRERRVAFGEHAPHERGRAPPPSSRPRRPCT